jgi:hypothetical protein
VIQKVEELPESGYTARYDVTLESHPDHHTVGKEYMGGYPWGRWLCESHDQCGYWMYRTDGSGRWTNVSERAIGRSFHEIWRAEEGKLRCNYGNPVFPYDSAENRRS